MKAGTKFALGAVLIVGSVGYLMAAGIRQTGQYFLTPSELAQRVSADPSFYDLGLKVGARVVPGTVTKEIATQTLSFHITDGTVSYPVVFKHGICRRAVGSRGSAAEFAPRHIRAVRGAGGCGHLARDRDLPPRFQSRIRRGLHQPQSPDVLPLVRALRGTEGQPALLGDRPELLRDARAGADERTASRLSP